MNPDNSEKSTNGFQPAVFHGSRDPFYRSQSNFTFQSSNSSSTATNSLYSSTKRQREDDCSSDGTLSSTLSFQASSENSAYHVPHHQSLSYNNCSNDSNFEVYPTSSFKRMKLEHKPHGSINPAPIVEYNTQTQALAQNGHQSSTMHQDTSMNYGYNDHVRQEPFQTNIPVSILPAQIIQRGTELPNNCSNDHSQHYSSVNKLLGSLHANRRNREDPNASAPQHTTLHSLANVGLYENVNITLQPRRRQNKRALLHTTSSLY